MMAAVAGATKRLKFGMNVVVVPFRDPMLLAKECATIDFISEGRLLPAFGVGAQIAPEWRAQQRSTKGRGRQADEALKLMKRFWTEETVTHDGEFYQYRDAAVAPKPAQDPVPLWIGGSSKAAIRRTAEIGTGWLAGLQTPEQVAPVVSAIQAQSAAVGRPLAPGSLWGGVRLSLRILGRPHRRSGGQRAAAARDDRRRPAGVLRRGRRLRRSRANRRLRARGRLPSLCSRPWPRATTKSSARPSS